MSAGSVCHQPLTSPLSVWLDNPVSSDGCSILLVRSSPVLESCRLLLPLESAKTHILSRLCGAPTSLAPSTPHRALYPNAAKSSRTTPSPLVRSRGEFSAKTKRGRISPMSLAYSFQSPERSPVIPAPLPAALMSWQGNPPQRTSTVPLQSVPSNSRMSPKVGKNGKTPSACLCSNTFLG